MELVKFLLMSKNQSRADGKSKFKKFFTSVNIVVKGEEEKGQQKKTLTVKFDKTIDTSNFVRGIVSVREDNIDIPYKFEIKEIQQADGTIKKRYPHIYVKKVETFEPRKTKSTATFNLLDEGETEEIEIDATEDDEEELIDEIAKHDGEEF